MLRPLLIKPVAALFASTCPVLHHKERWRCKLLNEQPGGLRWENSDCVFQLQYVLQKMSRIHGLLVKPIFENWRETEQTFLLKPPTYSLYFVLLSDSIRR